MPYRVRLLHLLFAALLAALASPARADAPLLFKKTITDIRERSVLSYLAAQKHLSPGTPYSLAAVDLNDDGVSEWIVRSEEPGCASSATCSFIVAALRSGTPAVLGTFIAGKIGVSDEKLYGVRNILVYNDKNDDFARQTLHWQPSKGAFGP